MINIHEIILKVHSNAVRIIGNDVDSIQAFDAADAEIALDKVQILAEIAKAETTFDATAYQRQRALEYPDFKDYLDGVVKGDQTQIQAYIDACLAVKAKYPKT